MITAAVTSAIVAICAFFGITLSLAQIGVLAVVVKVGVVSGILGYGLRWWRGRKGAASSVDSLPPAGSPIVRHETPESPKP